MSAYFIASCGICPWSMKYSVLVITGMAGREQRVLAGCGNRSAIYINLRLCVSLATRVAGLPIGIRTDLTQRKKYLASGLCPHPTAPQGASKCFISCSQGLPMSANVSVALVFPCKVYFCCCRAFLFSAQHPLGQNTIRQRTDRSSLVSGLSRPFLAYATTLKIYIACRKLF